MKYHADRIFDEIPGPVEIIFNMTRNGVLGEKKDYIFFGRLVTGQSLF